MSYKIVFYRIARWIFLLYAAVALLGLAYGAWFLSVPAGAMPNPDPAIDVLFVGLPWSFLALVLISGREPAVVLFAMLGVIPLGLNTYLLWLLQHWLGERARQARTPE